MASYQDEFQKRRKMRQKLIRRRRFFIGLIVLLILALIVSAVLALTVWFPVSEVYASGSKIYTSRQIVAASQLNEDDNVITFSASKVAGRLKRKLPYIEEVKFKRSLSGEVNITVSDAKEFAAYFVNGEYFAVSRSGRVLNSYDECPSNIFVIRADGVECKIGEALKFTNKASERNVNIMIDSLLNRNININEIDVTDPLSLSAKIENRFLVNFGTSGSLDKKITHLGGMVKSIDQSRSGRINLSMWTTEKTEGTFIEGEIQ